MAATKAMCRFLNHEKVTLPALIEPIQEAVREALQKSSADVVLLVHDWSMFAFNTHTSKLDRYRRSGVNDLGYDLGTALAVDAVDGRPLGAMEFRLRTANGLLSTRPTEVADTPAHVDELAGVMADSRRWNMGKQIIHIVDREADSVGHYRKWHASGHLFLVRAKDDRVIDWKGKPITLKALQAKLAGNFRDSPIDKLQIVETDTGVARVQVLETSVTLDRPAQTRIDGVKTRVSGPPLTLRLVLTRVVDELGVVKTQWLLLTNAPAKHDAHAISKWYTWRWRIESYHKLLKTAGMNAEEWQQESGEAFAKRMAIASMSCLTVWHLQQDDSPEAKKLKAMLIRLSGRQMKYQATDTAPALLAGLEKLLAVLDLLETHTIEEILTLARRVLPRVFNSA